MIKGSYQFASKKVDLANNANLKNYEELFKKTGIKYIYRSTENETSLTLGESAAKKLLANINEKVEILKECGVVISKNPSVMGDTVKSVLDKI